MRFLFLLLTTLVFVSCIEDAERTNFFIAEEGASLVYLGNGHDKDNEEEGNPWDTFEAIFPEGSYHEATVLKRDEEENPWDSFKNVFPEGSYHMGKVKGGTGSFGGVPKSEIVFLLLREPRAFPAYVRVSEIRGSIALLTGAGGEVLFTSGVGEYWGEGSLLALSYYPAGSKTQLPLAGAVTWRTVPSSGVDLASQRDVLKEVIIQPKDITGQRAASLLWSVQQQHKHDDPWEYIIETYRSSNRRTNGGKTDEDPWDTINKTFALDSVHTGKKKAAGVKRSSFAGFPISDVVFVLTGSGGIRSEEMELTLVERRGATGRFVSLRGEEVFGVGLPGDWAEGQVLEVAVQRLESPEDGQLAGVVTWSVVGGDPTLVTAVGTALR